ncbi:MAG: MMPL family transporter [Spirochaetes bacterium]|nr:MMPL family transporter [Spirochaetota bacterium]
MYRKILAHPKFVLVITGFVTLVLALQISNLRIDNDPASFIPKDHPSYLAKERTDQLFGEDLALSIGLRDPSGYFFTKENLKKLIHLSEALKNLPNVSDVTSLTTTDFIEGTTEGITVHPLLDPASFEGTEAEIESLKEKLRSWIVYDQALVSRDLSAVQVLVVLERKLSEEQREQVYHDTMRILQKIVGTSLEYHVAGTPAVSVLISENMRSDLRSLIPIVMGVVILTLYVSFRRWAGVLLPMLSITIGTIWTLGIMALCNITLSMVGTVIPVLLVAVGSAYGIHIVHRYYEVEQDEGRSPEDILYTVIRDVWKPVFLAGITTLIGFGSVVTSRVLPMRDFAIFTSLGVLFVMTNALVVIPCILQIRHNTLPPLPSSSRRISLQFLEALDNTVFRSQRRSILVFVGILALSVFGAHKLIVDNSLIEYFKKHTEVYQSDLFLRTYFAGTRHFSVVISGTKKGDLTDPRVLKFMDELANHLLEKHPEVSKVLSFTDFIKRMNSLLQPHGLYEIPADPAKYGLSSFSELKDLVSQYLLLYSGNLSKWADDALEPQTARMMVQLRTPNNSFTRIVVPEIYAYAQNHLPEGYRIEVSGIALIENTLVDLIVNAQITSISVSLALVILVIILSYRSFWIGLIGALPLGTSILINFALMGFTSIPLDISTAMVASVTTGIGIDYTIHFLSTYASSLKNLSSQREARRKTLTTVGPAILYNAVSVGAGFAVLLLSQFKPLNYFGLLIALTMFTSSIGALTIVPMALEVFKPRFKN